MFVLIIFAFIGGVITILSPCILPILPIVLSGSVTGGKKRPLGVVSGFILSFTFFTLFLTSIVKATGLSADFMRSLAVVFLIIFGFSLVVPKIQNWIEIFFTKFTSKVSKTNNKSGFSGGLLVGLSLGLIWTPCVGPILASVITLALSESISGTAFFITLAYAVGTAIPMFAVMYGGRKLIQKFPGLLKNSARIQQIFGVLMIVVAIGIMFNLDRNFQTYILEKLPSYGTGLTSIEDNRTVQKELDKLQANDNEESNDSKEINLAPEIIPGGQWFNSEPLKISDLKGKVVLVDFWTYTCINCIRTLPYIESWYEKYKDDGLVIIGVHSPEFEFEKDASNLARAIDDFGLTYPIVQDNNFATWQAYQNRYWPAKYFINKDGEIVDTHFGEGSYDESESQLQKLLAEAGHDVASKNVNNPTYQVEAQTPELYLGSSRINALASPEDIREGELTEFSRPEELDENKFSFHGDWQVEDEYAQPSAGASLTLNFQSKKVFLVMSPINKGGSVRVLLDGNMVDNNTAGDDVMNGQAKITEDMIYEFISLDQAGRHELTLAFVDGDVRIFTFTFG